MRQLVANLIGNALDAMSGSGRLIVAVNPSQDWKTGQRGIRLVVADTGSGMDESVRRRIFEPFFTTKEATGTGLGLWVSAEILAKHQATVRVRSRTVAPSGTVFMVFFPDGGLLAELAKEKDPAAVATV
jgi:signal transduction histidine kinase